MGGKAKGGAGPVADGLNGHAVVLQPRDSQVISGHDAIPGADTFGGGVEGDVEEVNADRSGVDEDQSKERVVEAAVEHRTSNIEHRTSKEIQQISTSKELGLVFATPL